MNATTAPESAALLDAANLLLDFTDLPLFDAIRPEQVEPAIDSLLQAAAAALEQVTGGALAGRWPATGLGGGGGHAAGQRVALGFFVQADMGTADRPQ